MFVHVAQHKQKLGLFVESGPNAIQSRCNVLAHVGPVWTAAGQLDFLWRRKQAVACPTNPVQGVFSVCRLCRDLIASADLLPRGLPDRGQHHSSAVKRNCSITVDFPLFSRETAC
jgi:hypothetical protein